MREVVPVIWPASTVEKLNRLLDIDPGHFIYFLSFLMYLRVGKKQLVKFQLI